ncbi:YihY/virulence factor BrkB family protein [Fictibacillus sp. Mic-4]|uniref:YihY/virulence factor BrkB family protein n=1 Tax=Fictibacillus sp. Mic-4 TaxID=3132826 RepID=UPI003CF957D4
MNVFKELNFLSPRAFFIEFTHGMKRGDVTNLSAQLAYYFLLSLFPFLIFLLTLTGFLITPQEAFAFLKQFLPGISMDLIYENIKNILAERKGGLLSFGIIATIWSTSTGLNSMIRAINSAYGVEECRSFITTRLLAIFLTFGIILAIIIALALPVFGKAIEQFVLGHLNLKNHLLYNWRIFRWVISFVVISFIFTILYFFAPCKKVKFTEVWYGAVFATLAWQLVSLGFAFYVDHFANYSATYGSLGAVIVLMIWFYLMAFVIITGGVINATFHKFKVDRAYKKGLIEIKK